MTLTGNISSELKKKFFMGPSTFRSGIQKSGSVSIIDTKLKSFKSNISEKQKLLNPATEISPSMKVFLETSVTKPPIFSCTSPLSPMKTTHFFNDNNSDEKSIHSDPTWLPDTKDIHKR